MRTEKLRIFLKNYLLALLVILAVILSIIIGVIMRSVNDTYSPRTVMYVNFVGDLFLRIIRALILPLIISSLITAIAPLDMALSKKIGVRAIIYILSTTIIAVILGIILVVTIKPGGKIYDENAKTERKATTIVDTILDLIRNIFPPNLIQATLQTYQTVLTPPNNSSSDVRDWKISGRYVDGTNMVGVVAASVIFGIAMSAAREKCENLLTIFLEFTQIMMMIVQYAVYLTPLGVFFLILARILEMENILDVFAKLGLYIATACGGNLIHGFLILPLIYLIFVRKNPYKFVAKIGPAIAMALGTSSSLAALPLNIQCCEENAKIDSRVTRFMLPLGATINMNGTALYEACAAIFIAQLRQIDLSIGNVIAVCITATAASVGTAGVPQAGLVTLIMVLDSIGLPAEDVSLIIAVDWIVGRIRTTINVMGDAYGAAIVEKLSQIELMRLPTIKKNIND